MEAYAMLPHHQKSSALLQFATDHLQIGTSSPSISQYIFRIETLVKQSALEYKVHDTGTVVEGPWTDVMNLIGNAHMEMHDQGVQRVHTDVRITTR
jgi:uncharacterized protein (TIGR00106 family)